MTIRRESKEAPAILHSRTTLEAAVAVMALLQKETGLAFDYVGTRKTHSFVWRNKDLGITLHSVRVTKQFGPTGTHDAWTAQTIIGESARLVDGIIGQEDGELFASPVEAVQCAKGVLRSWLDEVGKDFA